MTEKIPLKKSRFTDSQIIAVLKQAEAGTPVPELCREHGISSATFYKWRSKYGGMEASMVSRMKELEEENRGAEEDVCRGPDERRHHEGGALKKCMTRPVFARGFFFRGCGSSVCQNVSGLLVEVASFLALMEIRARQA